MPRGGRTGSRSRATGWWGAGWAVLLILAGREATAQTPGATPDQEGGFRPRIVREGTVSIAAQGGYGGILGGSDFADAFSSGPNLGMRLRYRTGRESAIGLGFDALRFDAKDDPEVATDPEWLQAVTTMAEYYQYFSVRSRSPRYLVLGAGLVQTRQRLQNDETNFPGDGGVVSLGLGTEYWWKRTVTFELSGRYYGLLRGEEGSTLVSHVGQLSLGIHFYTSR